MVQRVGELNSKGTRHGQTVCRREYRIARPHLVLTRPTPARRDAPWMGGLEFGKLSDGKAGKGCQAGIVGEELITASELRGGGMNGVR